MGKGGTGGEEGGVLIGSGSGTATVPDPLLDSEGEEGGQVHENVPDPEFGLYFFKHAFEFSFGGGGVLSEEIPLREEVGFEKLC